MKKSRFRYAGDKFAFILANCAEVQAQNIYGLRLLDDLHKNEENTVLSFGNAQTGSGGYLAPAELIRLADERIYIEKRGSKVPRQPPNA